MIATYTKLKFGTHTLHSTPYFYMFITRQRIASNKAFPKKLDLQPSYLQKVLYFAGQQTKAARTDEMNKEFNNLDRSHFFFSFSCSSLHKYIEIIIIILKATACTCGNNFGRNFNSRFHFLFLFPGHET